MEWTVEIEGHELSVELEIDFQPFEKQTHDYPGCEAGIDISEITLFGIDVPQGHPISKQIEADYDNIFEEYMELRNPW